MTEFGALLKYLRTSRHITQAELSHNLISRDTVVRIENNHQNPSFETGIQLLERLGISLSDFDKQRSITNPTSFSNLTQKFLYQLNSSGDRKTLTDVNKLARQIYQEEGNFTARNIMLVTEAMEKIDDWNFNLAHIQELRKLLQPVWSNLAQIDEWCMLDLRILDCSLFFFDLETAHAIMQHAFRIIDKKYPTLAGLKAAFSANYCYLLILNRQIKAPFVELAESRKIASQTGRYDLVIVADIRRLVLEQLPNYKTNIKHKLSVLTNLGATGLVESLKKEVQAILDR
ncbi:helix-turn-helix domain-containing protein [Fructilactobacillus myrtifloralis]|uniref:Helix-turn-helix domain-containing protein n=1 Tax=Fructilactobacillus myrtifloralis TaxID=2940301 RepID=A0ABY5BP53_9LACO|nr:helix-turn-helix transcriptional regulator [Fructilactobacillus myrtifloralis]USS85340.1 helix-turn-helix domain-containing protein [Fructilactobacillus myrtifloralis]